MKDPDGKAFKKEVLENDMFDDHDRRIIMSQIANFSVVFMLGADWAERVLAQEVSKCQKK